MAVMTTLATRPLKDMDATELTRELLDMVSREIPTAFDAVSRAVVAATFLHRNQTRANRANLPRTPYIEHPLRNTLRIMRWGVTETRVLVASLLHDTLEDCLDDIMRFMLELDPSDFSEAEKLAYATEWIRNDFGAGAARIIRAVTNGTPPAGVSRRSKNAFYVGHVAHAIIDDAEVFLVKFAEFMDNGAGLYHNNVPGNEGMVRRLAAKYRPLIDIFKAVFLKNPTMSGLIAPHGTAEILVKLDSSRDRLDTLLLAA